MIQSVQQRVQQGLRVTGFLAAALPGFAVLLGAAEPPRWTPATPFGGAVVALAGAPGAGEAGAAGAPAEPRRLYAATRLGPLFASRDGGGTWAELPVGGFLGNPLAGLVTSYRDPLTVFARTSAWQLLRSRDGGLDWSAVGANLPQVSALAQDGRDPAAWFAATTGGLYTSPDGGDSWSLAAFEDSSVVTVAVDPRDPDTLFVMVLGQQAGAPATLWQSTDHGATWLTTPLAVTPQGLEIVSAGLIFDPVRPGTVYATFGGNLPLYRSTDGGASWSALPASAGIGGLVVLPDGTLLGAADLGVSRSTDRGDSWQPPLPASGSAAAAPPDTIVQLAFAAAGGGTVLAAGSEGVWRSEDGGLTWAESSQGISTLQVLSLIAAPSGPDTILAAAGDSVFRSIDQGATWTRVFSAFSGLPPYAFAAFDPFLPRALYGIGDDGQADHLVLSTHRGSGWTPLPVPYECGGDSLCSVTIDTVAVDPRTRGRLYVGGSYFYHFGGSGSFLLRSDDGFATWTALTPPDGQDTVGQGFAVVIDPSGSSDGELLHALTCGGFMESRNGGTTWRKTGRGLTAPLCTDQAANPLLAADPAQPGVLYVGTAGQGVWRSGDAGRTFQPLNRGLAKATVASIVVDPTNSARIYAGVVHQGVFSWTPRLQRWVPLNAGLPVADFDGVLAIDPQRPSLLFAGTATQGVFRLDLAGAASAPPPAP